MDFDRTSVKDIVTAIEEYYNGKPRDLICAEHAIEDEVFDNWLMEYKQLTFELIELKMENERLRKMYVDQSLNLRSILDTWKKINENPYNPNDLPSSTTWQDSLFNGQ